MQFKQVLFPFDHSERCRHAACFVKRLLNKFGAQLTIVNVLEDPAAHYPASVAFAVPSVERRKLIEHSTTLLQNYAREAFPQCSVQAVCCMGDPAKEIIEVASEINANLIMMPTRGCGRLRAFLLGSVTAKVLDDAKCPVWTGAHVDDRRDNSDPAVRNVLCAVE
jgi:nucleotide-binding universal stress UspA family protein